MNFYILDEDNQPVAVQDAAVWGRWFETAPARQVALTKLDGTVNISTVFSGVDHGFGDSDGVPVLWETMIFGLASDDEFQWRYTSHVSALMGHEAAVELARELMIINPDL